MRMVLSEKKKMQAVFQFKFFLYILKSLQNYEKLINSWKAKQ